MLEVVHMYGKPLWTKFKLLYIASINLFSYIGIVISVCMQLPIAVTACMQSV